MVTVNDIKKVVLITAGILIYEKFVSGIVQKYI